MNSAARAEPRAVQHGSGATAMGLGSGSGGGDAGRLARRRRLGHDVVRVAVREGMAWRQWQCRHGGASGAGGDVRWCLGTEGRGGAAGARAWEQGGDVGVVVALGQTVLRLNSGPQRNGKGNREKRLNPARFQLTRRSSGIDRTLPPSVRSIPKRSK